ncbi:hypothetical protein AVEN_171625-1 [Araneus ventricosus]|uniref:Uncharacterized protein n=1 Tax=Araneus ventricosus TaxID=182803 RepID=A0A4Y2F2N5_ARAVE|nr:hypothetical protein AVEN_171625-1 [Araneus ventricosus]
MGSDAIVLANHSPFPCALREGYTRERGGGVNDHPGWESPIHVASSEKVQVLQVLEEKVASGLKRAHSTWDCFNKIPYGFRAYCRTDLQQFVTETLHRRWKE